MEYSSEVEKELSLDADVELNEAIDQLTVANCLLVWSCVEDGGWCYLEQGIKP